ncbi:MAG TPA: hypothetical protein VID26_11340 [Candidatus Limnocylindrales bacterium]|jgi:hypothetical protein
MIDPAEPASLDEYRRSRAERTRLSPLERVAPGVNSDASRLGLAIASVVDQRRWHDWAWLDQDKALHRP